MKRIIILGGGFAGSTAARILEKDFEVTLIDTKDYFEYTPGILRVIVSPKKKEKIQTLHKDYLKKTRIIRGIVTSIDKENVLVNNKKLSYDYLLICSGSRYNAPIKEEKIILANHLKHLEEKQGEFRESKRILIIGGGLVGVELACEICTKQEKGVTIVHAASRLLERNPEKVSKYAKKFLEKRGVRIVFSEFFKDKEKDCYLTNKGTRLKADLLFSCIGIIPNSEFMRKNFSQLLNEKNQIIVDKFLNIKEKKNIFAAGDVNNTNVEKTAQNAVLQAEIAAHNIKALEKHKKLREYKPGITPLVISLGKWKGIFVWKNFVLKGLIPGLMKHMIEFFYMAKYR